MPRSLIDLSVDVAGGYCSRLLAMGGWQVTRLSTGSSRASRRRMYEDADRWLAPYLDQAKTVVEIDDSKCNAATLADWVRGADAVVVSWDRGDVIGPLELSMIRHLNPTAVVVVTSSFGTTGPYRTYRGGPLVDWASGGWLYITGEPDREPLRGPLTLCGYVTAYTAAIAIERASLEVGVGRLIDISAMESMLSVHQSTFSRLGAGEVRTRSGKYTEVYPLVVLPCRDGYVSLGISTDAEFDRLALLMDRPELAVDERFATGQSRNAHRSELDRFLLPWLAERTCAELVEAGLEADVVIGKVCDTVEVLDNPQLDARDYWIDHDGNAKIPGNPIVSRARTTPALAPARGRRPTAASFGDVLVLDLTIFWAGPSATRILADLGARVVRIERPASEYAGNKATLVADDIMYLADEKWQRGKQSIILDLKSPRGVALAHQLVAKADVLVENFKPGVMGRLGLGYDEVAAINPGLVYVSLSGFGATGPWSERGSYGPTLEALSSIEWRTGYGDGVPLRLGHTLPDGVGGLAGALAALRGLRERAESGRGSHFDLSQLETYCSLAGEEVLACAAAGRAAPPKGNASDRFIPHGVYPTGGPEDDSWIAIACYDDEDWRRLRAVIPGWPDDLWPSLEQRSAHRRDIDTMLCSFTATRSPAALVDLLQRAGLVAFPALSAPALVADEHLGAREYFIRRDLRGHAVKLPGTPFVATPPLANTDGRAPRRGQHSATVLAELLGTGADEIARLLHDRVVIGATTPANSGT